MMLRMTSSVPPATRIPGTPSRNWVQAKVPQAPVSATRAGPSTEERSSLVRTMLAVSESLANDISGPGSCPTAIVAMARRLV